MAWDIPLLKIGNLEMKLIQGGMGVGISLVDLPVANAEAGGAGIIASVELGSLLEYTLDKNNPSKRNEDALRDVIRSARKKTNGIIGVNVMYALTHCNELAKVSFEEDVDLLITGAGPFSDLPRYMGNSKTLIAPIVNSARTANFFCRVWNKLGHSPDFIVVEGPAAGGHLGYDKYNSKKPEVTDNLDNIEFVEHGLGRIIVDVVKEVKQFEEAYHKKIPVVAAGGIFYGGDIRKQHELGASGVQMAQRLASAEEGDADLRWKQKVIDCKKEDIIYINSPVGMTGRAINNEFLESVKRGERKPRCCKYQCLKTCNPVTSSYCIAQALKEAQKGNLDNGFVFSSTNAWRNKEDGIVPIKNIYNKLPQEYLDNKRS